MKNNLQELVSEETWKKKLETEPVWGVENARTIEDLNRAIKSLVEKSIPDEEWVESLILTELKRNYFSEWSRKLTEWYLMKNDRGDVRYRSDQSYARAFRFCSKLTRYNTTELRLFNKVIKEKPFLYWVSCEYQRAVKELFDWFNSHFSKNEPYSESSWDCIASVIRRIVQVGDVGYLDEIKSIQQRHNDGTLKANENDPFFAGEVRVFLENAISLLEKAKKEQESGASKLSDALQNYLRSQTKVSVDVFYPRLVTLQGEPNSVEIQVRLTWSNTSLSDEIIQIHDILSRCEVSFEVDGSLQGKKYLFLKNSHADFSFVPLLGRQRFWLIFRMNTAETGIIDFRSAYYLTVNSVEK